PHDTEFLEALCDQKVSVVAGHFCFGLHTYLPERSWTYMTLLRHPVTRVKSLYRHITAHYPVGEPLGDEELPYQRGTDLMTLFDRYALRELDNDQTRRIAGVEPAYGQCTREMLELAKRRLDEDIALVGTVERFDDSVRLAAETLHWRRGINKGRLNE